VRQLLAGKISGTMVGLLLLIPEYLRLGVWDLMCGWTGASGNEILPRQALQKVNEAAVCQTRVRQNNSLSQKGFEIANGLPYVVSDKAMYDMIENMNVADSQRLQIALGQIRQASGHFQGRLLAIDPHNMPSASKRQMPQRRSKTEKQAQKKSRGFFCIDVETQQPVCFTLGSSAKTVVQATPELLNMAEMILNTNSGKSLLLADSEHFGAELVEHIHINTPFDLLVPMPSYPSYQTLAKILPQDQFSPHWIGMETAKIPFGFNKQTDNPYYMIIQRTGVCPDDFRFKSFLSTNNRNNVEALTIEYPERWHAEEFFNANQELGWKKARTMNLNVRYAQMTAALVAQAATSQLKNRFAETVKSWNAKHFADAVLKGIDGDIKVANDTIIVTFYNALPFLEKCEQLENIPEKLEAENVDPRIPWLYDFKIDFRFK